MTVPPTGAINWESIPARTMTEGVTVKRYDTDSATLFLYEMEAGTQYPIHKHPEAQLVCVLEGSVQFYMGDQDRWLLLEPQAVLPVKGDVPHGSRIDGNAPARFLNIVVPPRPAEWKGPESV